MVVKHCSYGTCKSDSRNAQKPEMKGVFFIRFPQPHRDPAKTDDKVNRWLRACGREHFTLRHITRFTYICSLHFVGGNGPTELHPDPIPAVYCPEQVAKFSKKRKAPADRSVAAKLHRSDSVVGSSSSFDPSAEADLTWLDHTETVDLRQTDSLTSVALSTASTDTVSLNAERELMNLNDKINAQHLKIEELKRKLNKQRIVNRIKRRLFVSQEVTMASTTKPWCINDFRDDDNKFKFYTGLSFKQFLILWEFLGPSSNKLVHWSRERKGNISTAGISPSKRAGRARKLSPKSELFLTLIRLRMGLLTQDIAYRFAITSSTVSNIVTTWVQFLYLQFSRLRSRMFPSRHKVKKCLPKSFKKRMFRNIRVIIDCSELRVQSPKNFQQQGNLYSRYKSHTTYKFLIGITPTGAISYVSDLFEGAISDNAIVRESGFIDCLEAGDLVLADRGFTIRDMLYEKRAELVIPPFLQGRSRFTPAEEVKTRQIANVCIHVERAIQRVKKFRILSNVIPLNLASVSNQLVFVTCCLVNFQGPLVS